jgi:hypothetical protein
VVGLGELLGEEDGSAVGVCDGTKDGLEDTVGTKEGLLDGENDGFAEIVGLTDGARNGAMVGRRTDFMLILILALILRLPPIFLSSPGFIDLLPLSPLPIFLSIFGSIIFHFSFPLNLTVPPLTKMLAASAFFTDEMGTVLLTDR